MAFINFDCPDCGHNLEVDERGAGFIVKCPECQEPIQIPDMPTEAGPLRAHIKAILLGVAAIVVIAAAAWGVHAYRGVAARADAAEKEVASLRDQLEEAADRLEVQLQTQKIQHRSSAREQMDALDNVTHRLLDQANAYLRSLDDAERRLVESSKHEQEILVRADMKERLEEAKEALPLPPEFGDAEAGRGLQNSGRTLVFPVLLGANGKPLRENAEITSVNGDEVSVRFEGGGATYRLAELHPGVAAYLPAVDPVLLVPPVRRKPEALRLHQLRCARRAEELAAIGQELDEALFAEP